jgi:hypothetical protein
VFVHLLALALVMIRAMEVSLNGQKDRSTEDHSLFKAANDRVALPVLQGPHDTFEAERNRPPKRSEGIFQSLHLDWRDSMRINETSTGALTQTNDKPKRKINGSTIGALRIEHSRANNPECLHHIEQANAEAYLDYGVPLERKASKNLAKLRRLMQESEATSSGTNDT